MKFTIKETLPVGAAIVVAAIVAFVVASMLWTRQPTPAEGDRVIPDVAIPLPGEPHAIGDLSISEAASPAACEPAKLVARSTNEYDADTAAGCRVDVLVTDADTHAPIVGASVTCEGDQVAKTDDAGRTSFNVDRRRVYAVRATSLGYCPARHNVELDPTGTHAVFSVTLVRPATVHGIVRGPDGEPARGAEVVIYLWSPGVMHPVASFVDGLPNGTSIRTDAEGAFRFDGIGSYKGLWRASVAVIHDGCALFEGEQFEVHNGETVGPLLCQLREGVRIRGRVTAFGVGAPATIFVGGASEPVKTDATGSYESDHVPPGPTTLYASLNDRPWVRASIPLDLQPSEERVQDIALDHEMRVFTGLVSTPESVALAGVRVWCETEGFHDLEPVRYWARTGSNGTYRLEAPVRIGESDLAYTLRLERWEEDCAVTASSHQAMVDIVCVGSSTVAVTVVDESDGQLVRDCEPVWFSAGDAGQFKILQDFENQPNGKLVAVVPAGAGRLRLRQSRYQPYQVQVTTQPGDYIDLGQVQLDPVH